MNASRGNRRGTKGVTWWRSGGTSANSKNSDDARHSEIAGSPTPNSVCIPDRLRLHRDTASPSIAATTIAAAGPDMSAAVKKTPSDTEMVARIDGIRMLSRR